MSSESGERPASPRIWIDADACPGAIKELVLRMSRRRQVLSVSSPIVPCTSRQRPW